MAEGCSSVEPRREVEKALRQPDEPLYTAVIYRVTLDRISKDDVLYGTCYIGQSVRVGTPEEVAGARWKEEIGQAAREDKQIGFIAALEEYGEDAFTWQVLCWITKPRSEAQEWADAIEVEEIDVHGGVLRDMNPLKRIEQTFNQTKGGSGNARWAGIDAFRTKKWRVFEKEITAYAVEHQTAYVPQDYVNPVTGYRLGYQCSNIRRGHLLKGHPEEDVRRSWLQTLSGWVWNTNNAPEYRQRISDCAKAQALREEREDPGCRSRRSKLAAKQAEDADPGICSRRTQTWHDNMSAEMREQRSKSAKEAAARLELADPGYHSRRAKARADAESPEARQLRVAKITAIKRTPESREKSREKSKAHCAKEEAENPGARSRQWKEIHAREDVKQKMCAKATANSRRPESKQALSDRHAIKRQKLHAEKKATLSHTEFVKWEKMTLRNERGAARRTEDSNMVCDVFPDARSKNISQYRKDGTVRVARMYNDLLDGLLSELAVECLV